MFTINIVAAGDLKEEFYRAAAAEYIKMLSAYAKTNIIQTSDIANKMIEAIPHKSYKIALCVEGAAMPSEAFAEKIEKAMINGYSSVTFVIGGSEGLDESVKSLCDMRLSFSQMTFPHRLMRIILLEQIYRAFTIINGKTYHK